MKYSKIFLLSIVMMYTLSLSADDLKLWYSNPAKTWIEALPLGNSRLGVMVFGGTDSEELQLNEETVWGGGPHRNDNPEALQALPQIRQLVLKDVIGKRKIWYPGILRLPETECLIRQLAA